MRIGFGKLGRSTCLDEKKWGVVGGDHETKGMLVELAERNPEHEFVVIGRRTEISDEALASLPANIDLPSRPPVPNVQELVDRTDKAMYELEASTAELVATITECDRQICFLGQHGASSFPIPLEGKGGNGMTKALTSAMNYTSPFTKGFNAWQDTDPSREVIWLNTDVRNWLKARDLKWHPREPIITQYTFGRNAKAYRFGDPRTPEELGYRPETVARDDGVWKTVIPYRYGGMEVACLADWNIDTCWEDRSRFGVLHNGSPGSARIKRAVTVNRWAVPCRPDWIVGKWGKEADDLEMEPSPPVKITEVPRLLNSVKCIFLDPALGYGWVTSKIFEAWSCGAVPFVHPDYDDQGNVLPTLEQISRGEVDQELAHLAVWLRPQTPEELETRIDTLNESRGTWDWLSQAGYRYFVACRERKQAVRIIEARLGLAENTDDLWTPPSVWYHA